MARTGRPVAAGWARAVLGGAEVVVVRRSGVPQQDVLVFTLEEWAAFLAGVLEVVPGVLVEIAGEAGRI